MAVFGRSTKMLRSSQRLATALARAETPHETQEWARPNKEEVSQSEAAASAGIATSAPCSGKNPEKIGETEQVDLDVSQVSAQATAFDRAEE